MHEKRKGIVVLSPAGAGLTLPIWQRRRLSFPRFFKQTLTGDAPSSPRLMITYPYIVLALLVQCYPASAVLVAVR